MAASGVKTKTSRITEKKTRSSLYMENMLSRKVAINYNLIGSNINKVLETELKNTMEGKCTSDGYIKPDSIRVQTYSSGNLVSNKVVFQVTFTCLICNPVEGLKIDVKAKNITKAGIRAVYSHGNENETPIDVFIARDHSYSSELFNKIKEDDIFKARIIGTRYELNDTSISVLATIVKSQKKRVAFKISHSSSSKEE